MRGALFFKNMFLFIESIEAYKNANARRFTRITNNYFYSVLSFNSILVCSMLKKILPLTYIEPSKMRIVL